MYIILTAWTQTIHLAKANMIKQNTMNKNFVGENQVYVELFGDSVHKYKKPLNSALPYQSYKYARSCHNNFRE